MKPRSWVSALLLSLALAATTSADSLIPYEQVSLDDLSAFRSVTNNWRVGGAPGGDPRHAAVSQPLAGKGVLISNPAESGKNDQLLTTWEHGDIDVELDFLLTPHANSGVYLQGRYEVQLFDSWLVKAPSHADNGGIYQRWDPARGPGHEGFDGHAPKANASRAPGLWQHVSIRFRAPRFDAKGMKTANAKIARVELNGFVVQEDVELSGPTRAAPYDDEKPTGPLMIQSNHGPVAIRNLRVKRYTGATVAVKDLYLKYYGGRDRDLSNYASGKATRETKVEHFSGAVLSSDERGVASFTGKLEVPVDGLYQLRADVNGPARIMVDGAIVVSSSVNAEQSDTVSLTAGAHDLKVDFQYIGSWALANGGLKVWIEGPGIPEQQLVPATPRAAGGRQQISIPVEPKDRVLTQRTFVPLPASRRLYATFVGTPAGIHYAYDFESACIIRVWRGGFFEGRDLWHERAEDQEAHPTGPGFAIEGKPLLFQFGDHDAFWPTRPPGTSQSNGYRLEADGQPVFFYEFSGVSAEDRIAPLVDGSGLTRTLKFSGKPRSRDMWVLLAEDKTITRQPDGGGFIIGDRAWYLDWPKDAAAQPALRREGDRVQLIVRLTGYGPREITYNLVW